MIERNPSEDEESSSHVGLSTSSFTNTHGLQVGVLFAYGYYG